MLNYEDSVMMVGRDQIIDYLIKLLSRSVE